MSGVWSPAESRKLLGTLPRAWRLRRLGSSAALVSPAPTIATEVSEPPGDRPVGNAPRETRDADVSGSFARGDGRFYFPLPGGQWLEVGVPTPIRMISEVRDGTYLALRLLSQPLPVPKGWGGGDS